MAIVWRKIRSFDLPYSLLVLCLFAILAMSHFGVEGKTLVLIAPVPGHCLPFYLYKRPYKACIIANSCSCTTTILSKVFTSFLRSILHVRYLTILLQRNSLIRLNARLNEKKFFILPVMKNGQSFPLFLAIFKGVGS